MAKWGYARVSSVGQSLESQLDELKKEGVPFSNIKSEHITGTKANRPEFNKVLRALKEGDTLYVTKLDRFARNTEDGIRIINELFKRGVRVHVLNLGLIEDTPVGRLMLNVIMAIAEFERDLIWERTQTGKMMAQQKDPNYKEGRKRKHSLAQLKHAMELHDESKSPKEITKLTGISRDILYRALRERKAKGYLQADYKSLERYEVGELEL
jgi:DNA invertase Pin-like site-specific DNA recombinase